MKKNFNKKPLIALFVIGLVVAIGGTIAYYTDSVSIPNIFGTKTYQTQVVETFDSPENWLPGQTVSKVVTAKNPGDIEVAVRAKYVEAWTDKNNQPIDLTQNPSPVTITMDAGTDAAKTWTEKQTDGYFYFKRALAAKDGATIDETTPFISAVKLNDNAIPDNGTACSQTGDNVGAGTTTWTCQSDSVFGGATYTLTVTVETVQADAYHSVWDTTTPAFTAPTITGISANY